MTPQGTAERIPVMQAHAEGKQIEVRCHGEKTWMDAHSPDWNWEWREYRVKKIPRTFWINEYTPTNFGQLWTTEAQCDDPRVSAGRIRKIKLVEVLE